MPFGVTIASGFFGFLVLVVLTALWGMVYAGFMQIIALKTRSAAATNSAGLIFFPLLFLTPSFVPRPLLRGFGIVGLLGIVMVALNVRLIHHYD